MRYAFLVPLACASLIAFGMWAGGAHLLAPFAMTAFLGASCALHEVRKEVI